MCLSMSTVKYIAFVLRNFGHGEPYTRGFSSQFFKFWILKIDSDIWLMKN